MSIPGSQQPIKWFINPLDKGKHATGFKLYGFSRAYGTSRWQVCPKAHDQVSQGMSIRWLNCIKPIQIKTKLNAFILSRFRLIQGYQFAIHRSGYLKNCEYIWLIRCEAGLHAGNCNRTG